jgi:1-acyl-sn-glycerol-3-phosphate acyltransferase
MLLRIITGLAVVLAVVLVSVLDAALWLLPVLFFGLWLAGLLLAFLVLWGFSLAVDMNKPQETDSKLYRRIVMLYIEALIPLVRLKMEVEGLEKMPDAKRIMLVCNHQNEGDPGILMHYFKRYELSFVAKKEVESMFIMGKLMHKLVCQPINRENDREALKSILKCIQLLKNDEVSIGAFPEGGIFDKDKLHPFRSGVFKIAQKAKVPIVVCTLKGTSELFHNMKRLKKTHVQLHLVDVISAEETAVANTVELGDRIYQMMLEDLGPEYAPENTETT